jgi:MFS family permease
MTGLLLPLSTFFMESSMELELLTCFIFLFGSPAASSANLIASEIFPTSTRPIILSIIFLVGMGGAICGVWVNNYYISAGLMLIGGICGFLFSPQSENKSLE